MKTTQYTLEKLIEKYPNDQELGRAIRKLLKDIKSEIWKNY
jgi:hypothetical protein